MSNPMLTISISLVVGYLATMYIALTASYINIPKVMVYRAVVVSLIVAGMIFSVTLDSRNVQIYVVVYLVNALLTLSSPTKLAKNIYFRPFSIIINSTFIPIISICFVFHLVTHYL